jgi:hypothetical protein
MPTRTIAYLHVSTAKQACRGVSLEAQHTEAEPSALVYELVEVTIYAGANEYSLII